MKGSVIALGAWQGRGAAARLLDGRLDDLILDPPDDTPRPGAICRAVADRPLKGQGGITLRLPGGLRGYLRHAGGMRPGVPVLVQVSSYAEPGKAVPVTTRLLFKGRHAILTPDAPGINVSRRVRDPALREALVEAVTRAVPDGMGAILRSAAVDAPADQVASETAALAGLAREVMDGDDRAEWLLAGPDAHRLALRDWPEPDLLANDPGAFAAHEVDAAIEAERDARLALPGGATAFVEPTRALVAVDVNTAGDTSPAAGLKAGLALARELPRALRCRGLGGQITVDFAPIPKRDRRQVEAALQAAFRADPVETALAGWTPLGHFELQRKRERAPLDWR